MMNYEAFKKEAENKFMEYMPEKMRHMKMDIHQVDKVNVTLDGISITSEKDGVQVSPIIFINDMYENYLKSGDLEKTLQMGAFLYVTGVEKGNHIEPDIVDAKDNIVFQIINTEKNRKLLATVPSRPFYDLSIIYRWVLHADKDDFSSAVINNNLAMQLGFTEEQLYRLAVENTKRILPPAVKSVDGLLNEIRESVCEMENHIPSELTDRAGSIPPELNMWVITNNFDINGAAAMLYEDVLYTLAERLGAGLYIMPSSIHEVMAVADTVFCPDILAGLVMEANREVVSSEERLSNQVYHYDRALRKLTLCSGPDKEL